MGGQDHTLPPFGPDHTIPRKKLGPWLGPASTIMRVHLVRHGEVHNPRSVMYGRLPRFRLSAHGVRQAEEAAAHLASRQLALILCSPMLRARTTARELQRGQARAHRQPQGPPLRQEAALLEVHTPHDGKPLSTFAGRWHTLYDDVPEGYETFEAVASRLRSLLARLAADFGEDAEVACVTHGDVVFSARLLAEGLPTTLASKKREDARLYPATASIVSLDVDADGSVRGGAYWAPTRAPDRFTETQAQAPALCGAAAAEEGGGGGGETPARKAKRSRRGVS